ncbi:MAG: T9SS type A sorting domain-containing protein [Bacteroidota bacterium]
MKKITLFVMLTFAVSFAVIAQSEVCPMQNQQNAYVNAENKLAIWDELFAFNTSFAGQQGIAFVNNMFWTSSWSTSAYFKRYNATTYAFIDSVTVTGVPAGLRDFAFDGTYLYGGANSATIYKIDPTALTSTTITASGITSIRHCSYDPLAYSGAGGFWVGTWADLFLVPKTGGAATVTGPVPTSAYGSCYDGVSQATPCVWLFCQTVGGVSGYPGVDLVQYDIATNTFTGTIHDNSGLSSLDLAAGIAGGCEATYNTIVPGGLVILLNVQQSPNRVYGLDMGTVAIDEATKGDNLAVWPNPAQVNSTINMITTSNISNVKMYNAIGEVVYNENCNKHEVNISTAGLTPGTYFINVIKEDGMVTRKVVLN